MQSLRIGSNNAVNIGKSICSHSYRAMAASVRLKYAESYLPVVIEAKRG